MTDRMSNIEIEDVLSSIRKLVSDDLRPGAAPVSTVTAPLRPQVPRLVLTPALRVPAAAPAAPPLAPDEPDHATGGAPEDGIAGRLAELEALMAGQAHEFEDEAASQNAPSGIAPTAPDHHGADAPEAPFVGDEDHHPAGDGFDWADPSPAVADPVTDLDDAALRDLIRDVLREELQGAMGERVTRNLRKLVRAEIARALTARGIA